MDIVIAAYDRGFDYREPQIAFDAIWFRKRARLVTTDPDRSCPFPGARGEPDVAAIVGAVEGYTGASCEVNVGRTDPIVPKTVADLVGLGAGDRMMTGDGLHNEIRMALDAGMSPRWAGRRDDHRAFGRRTQRGPAGLHAGADGPPDPGESPRGARLEGRLKATSGEDTGNR